MCLYISYFTQKFKKKFEEFEHVVVYFILYANCAKIKRKKKKFEKCEHVLAYLRNLKISNVFVYFIFRPKM